MRPHTLIIILAQITLTHAFTGTLQPHTAVLTKLHRPPESFSQVKTTTELNSIPPIASTAVSQAVTTAIRGGCQSKALQTLASSLRSGPYGVLSLFTYALALNLPLTIYRQAYSFSVGYGFSILAMATACAFSFRPTIPSCVTQLASAADPSFLLLSATAFYGMRLGLFLLVRELTVPSKAKTIREMDKTPRPKRVMLSVNVSLFYALMTSPLMYALRSPVGRGNVVAMVGATLAWFGAALEAVTDLQKWIVKRGGGDEGEGADEEGKKVFRGPTGWAYSIVRHPNYLGEVLFWTGLFVGGVPSFGRNYIAWIGSVLGLSGIWFIMTSATKRLEKIQKESYEGQEKYENWALRTRYPLIPFLV